VQAMTIDIAEPGFFINAVAVFAGTGVTSSMEYKQVVY